MSMPVAKRAIPNRTALLRNVLSHVQRSEQPLRPTQLIRNLTTNYPYSDVQRAVSELLERRQIELTPARFVVLRTRQSTER
jgi:hypothetical protein